MTALPYQPVPTATQRRELERLLASDRAKRYAVRQYADNQPKQALISPVEAAGVACCATNVADEATHALPEIVIETAKGLVFIAGWLAAGLFILWLCDVAGQYFGRFV
jgi:hypothetical protein